MSIASPKSPATPGTLYVQAVSLRYWVPSDRPLLSLALSLAVVVVASLIYFESRNTLGTVLATTALVISMRRVWLPIRFRLDAQGIIRSISGRSRRIPWSAVSRYEVCRRGVVLFPQGADYRLAAGQGLFIPWAGRREEVLAIVRKHASPPPRCSR